MRPWLGVGPSTDGATTVAGRRPESLWATSRARFLWSGLDRAKPQRTYGNDDQGARLRRR
jgi:hypothetical protein